MTVSVVIINFNTGELVSQVVERVFAQNSAPLECIVVDNSSNDDSLEILIERVKDDRLSVVRNAANVGFAAGCNIGIARCSGDYILLLNPDCLLEDDALDELVRTLWEDEDAGAAGPLVRNMDGTEQRGCRREIPTPWQIFCVGLGLHRLMRNHPRFRSFNQTDLALPDEPIQVQSVSGACILVKREALERVGLFDERYFMHFEDIDWCMRAGEAGYHTLFVPDAVAWHVGGVSSRNRRFRVEAHKHTSLIRFVRANFAQYYPSAFIVLVSLIVYARWLLVVLRMLVFGRRQVRVGWDHLFTDSTDGAPGSGAIEPKHRKVED